MKTTNAENDGKANDRQIDILTEEHPVDAAEIAFLRGLRRGLVKARAYTVPGSIIQEQFDELIRQATGDIEAVEARIGQDTLPSLTLRDILSLPADLVRYFPVTGLLYGTFLLAMAFAAACAFGWL